MKKILVLCTGNSCRSQMMQGYLTYLAKDKAEVYSAGIETHGVNPKAVATLAEDGIDISHNTSNHLDEYRDLKFDYVITVCDHANENCPWFPHNALRLHENFADPSKVQGSAEEISKAFKATREKIKSYATDFVNKYLP